MSLTQRTQAAVTVSGLTLACDRDTVFRQLGQPNFQTGSPKPVHVEYWYDFGRAALRLDFDERGRLLQAQGGEPEINRESVRSWSLEEVERALGPAAGASSGQSLTAQGWVGSERFLRYPGRQLLVRQNPDSSIEFLLFTGTR